MIKDPISKLYKHMTSKELAALAFANLANNDPLEEARISDAVPRHTYICLDATFRQHLDGIFNMACCWSIQYWQCTARLMAANGSLLANLKNKDDIKQWALDDEIRDYHARQLAALEVALVEICHEHHIDIHTVKQIAGITNNTELKTIPDADYLLHIKGEMCAVLACNNTG
jgi:hypothetical protein